jgi:hypothetical protein
VNSVFSVSDSDPTLSKCPALKANGVASLHRAEARGEDPMGLVGDMFEGEIPEEIDAMT